MILRNEKGQSQILLVTTLSIAMITAALFSLQRVERINITKTKSGHKAEMRAALKAAVNFASNLYRTEAACDPVTLNQRLSFLEPDGTIRGSGAPTSRLMNFPVSGRNYQVSFGPLVNLEWRASVDPSALDYRSGISQDASLEVWTTWGDTRVSLTAVLVNDCTTPCSSVYVSSATGNRRSPCEEASDPTVAFHRVTSPATFPDATGVGDCGGLRFGDLACAEGLSTTDGAITLDDWLVLRNHIRTGSNLGAADATGVLCNPSFSQCADLNQDGLVNEIDLGVMTRFMRGYIYRLPVR